MRHLLQGWPSPRHRDCPQLGDPPSAMLLDLPDAATAALVEYLDMPSLRAVALGCRGSLPALAEAFQSRFMLRLPPDAPRNEVLMRLVQGSSTVPGPQPRRLLARFFRLRRSRQQNQVPIQRPPLRTLVTQFAIADTDHASDLGPVDIHVQGLLISSNEYTAWPERPFRMDVLGKFTALKRLVIDYAWDRRVDLTVLSASVPQLQELVLKLARAVTGRLAGLSRLRVLHLEDTNVDSFAVAVGLPSLQSLTLIPSTRIICLLRDVAMLANVAPLRCLVVFGTWLESPCVATMKHHATLREYAELRHTTRNRSIRDWQPEWPAMVQLRSLQLGWYAHTDTTALASLVALEELQIVIAEACQHCVPLRRLKRLRELDISNGWVCDVVWYLPRLEKLVWDGGPEVTLHSLTRRTLFHRRASGQPVCASDCDEVSSLRVLVLHGNTNISRDCASVRKLLQYVEQLEVRSFDFTEDLFMSVARLRHLKRLAIRVRRFPWIELGCQRLASFACAGSLEELYFLPIGLIYIDQLRFKPLPLWFHDRLPNLRVLASPFQESMAVLARLCPRLTHVHLPFSRCCAFWRTRRATLARLWVVTLALKYDCRWLRRERGPGRALPSLRRIFHPTTDCLSCPTACNRYTTVYHEDEPPHCYQFFTAWIVCQAPWGQPWPGDDRRHRAEHYHRLGVN